MPAHLFRQAAQHGLGLVKNSVQRRESEAFNNEVQLRSLISFFRQRRRDYIGGQGRSTANEVVNFVRSLIAKKAKYITPRDH